MSKSDSRSVIELDPSCKVLVFPVKPAQDDGPGPDEKEAA